MKNCEVFSGCDSLHILASPGPTLSFSPRPIMCSPWCDHRLFLAPTMPLSWPDRRRFLVTMVCSAWLDYRFMLA